MVRRSRFEINVEVLKNIHEGLHKQTQIMYRTNLTWKNSRDILDFLVNQGLITESDNPDKDKRTKKLYHITLKGVNVVQYYSKAKELVTTLSL